MASKYQFEIKKVGESFNSKKVLHKVDLKIKAGKITAIVGPNGSGKSTLLNLLAGIGTPDSGEIVRTSNSELSYVIQDYRSSLFPWKNNLWNLCFPLLVKKISWRESVVIAKKALKLSKFDLDLTKFPYQLSGGQQQLISFLRAFIIKPKILLLDEITSGLDIENRLKIYQFIQSYYLQYRPTIIIVTQSLEEAVLLAEQIIIMPKSVRQQIKVIQNNLDYPRPIDRSNDAKRNHILSLVYKTFLNIDE